jgi:hypothetical protein
LERRASEEKKRDLRNSKENRLFKKCKPIASHIKN